MVASARARGRVWLAGIGVLGMMAPAAAQQHDPFYWLGEMNKASAVMVVERGIVPPTLGGKIADTIRQVLSDGERPGAIRSGNYLIVEEALIKIGGPEVTRLHSGRSRQDIGATMQRLAMREDLLTAFDKLNAARAARSRRNRQTQSCLPTPGVCRRNRSRSDIISVLTHPHSSATPSACAKPTRD
jgi:hypothetical protein